MLLNGILIKMVEVKKQRCILKKLKKHMNFYQRMEIEREDIEDMSYSSILKKCIYFVMPDFQWDDLFLDSTLQTVFKDCKKASIKLFEKLSKEKSLEVYEFLSTHRDILNLEDEMLANMLEIIKTKTQHDNIIILNPDINDLLNDKIYKLEVNESTFYVPLLA